MLLLLLTIIFRVEHLLMRDDGCRVVHPELTLTPLVHQSLRQDHIVLILMPLLLLR